MVNDNWIPPEPAWDTEHVSEAEFAKIVEEAETEMAELEARLGCTWAEHVNRRKEASQ